MRFVGGGWSGAGAVALLLGAALRIAFLHHAPPLSGDTLIYGQIARNWMETGLYGYTATGGAPHATLIRLPGYPLFLAMCFRLFGVGNYLAVTWVQAAVDLVTCLLVSLTARRIFGPRAGFAALLLGCLCPFPANYVAAPLTETLTLNSIALAVYALTRWLDQPGVSRWLWLVAAALACSLLLRPEQALLSVAVAPVLWWRAIAPGASLFSAKRLAPAVFAIACVLLPLAPWTARNWRTFHVFEPLAPRYATDPGETIPFGFQRWYRTWAVDFASTEDVYWNFDGAQIKLDDLPSRAFDSPQQRTDTANLLADYNDTTDPTPEVDARFARLARQRVAASRVRYYLELPCARLVNMLLRPRTELMGTTLDWWNRRQYPHDFRFALSYAAINLLYLLLGIAGLLRWWPGDRAHRPILAATLAFVLLRCALLLTIDNSEPRYTLEFFPVLWLWASALVAPRKRLSSAGRRSSSYPS